MAKNDFWIHVLSAFSLGVFSAISFFFISGCAFFVRTPAYHPASEPSEEAPRKYSRGVFHVHSDFSHDSQASFEKILRTAQKGDLDFVVITDHNTIAGAKTYSLLNMPARPLLAFGTEISAPDGHLIALGVRDMPPHGGTSQQIIDWIHSEGGYAILPHPVCKKNPWKNWNVEGVDGLEVYNFGHSFYLENKAKLAAMGLFLFPRPFLKAFQNIQPKAMNLWDEKLQKGKMAGLGAADAHIHVQFLGMTPENFLMAMQAVTLYAQLDHLTSKEIFTALATGRSFIVFEARGMAKGFSYTATSQERLYGPGDSVMSPAPVFLSVATPEASHIRLIHNGKKIKEVTGKQLFADADKEGAYRVEVDRDGKPWIITNPIYVQK